MTEQRDIYPNEQMLWTGTPVRVPMFERNDLFMAAFVAVWLTVVLFAFVPWGYTAGGPPSVFTVLFVAFGLYATVGRVVVRWLALSRSQYTITDRRLIVTTRVFGRPKEYTEYLRNLQPPVLREHGDLTGTISFGGSNMPAQVRGRQRNQPVGNPLVLHRVPNARYVRDLIATAQENAPRE